MNVAIIGCGEIGKKRASSLGSHTLLVAADQDWEKAEAVVKQHSNAVAMQSYEAAVAHPDVDIVIVSTTPDCLPRIALAALTAGKHVLMETPGARHHKELDAIIDASRRVRKKVRIGFNLRYHPAMQQAKDFIEADEIGPLLYIRGRYGHGGQPGCEKPWQTDPGISGGGALIDQGLDLIDLSRWFLGEFVHVDGYVKTFYWQMPVEDNGFMMLRTRKDQVAWLQVSWTDWKHTFSLEICGRDGKIQIDGLGGSYGTEQLALYKLLAAPSALPSPPAHVSAAIGAAQTTIWQYPGEDQSWTLEFEEFVNDIRFDRYPEPNLEDAQEALTVVHKVYEATVATVCAATVS